MNEKLAKHNINLQAYRANNSRFAEKGFMDEVIESNQGKSFCGVGARHQNGAIERCIGKINTRSRTMLLHAKRFWPEDITHILWPFVISAAINLETH